MDFFRMYTVSGAQERAVTSVEEKRESSSISRTPENSKKWKTSGAVFQLLLFFCFNVTYYQEYRYADVMRGRG